MKYARAPDIKSKIDKTTKVFGRVEIGKGCRIINSEIRGPVSILDDATITDAYIGPYTAVGKGCLIQGSRIENCVLMDKVKIVDVKTLIDNSLIGPESEITGNGAHKDCFEFFVGEKATIKL